MKDANGRELVLVPKAATEPMLDHLAGTRFRELPSGKQANEVAAYKAMLIARPSCEPSEEWMREKFVKWYCDEYDCVPAYAEQQWDRDWDKSREAIGFRAAIRAVAEG